LQKLEPTMTTLHNHLELMGNMLEATKNLLMAQPANENDASRKFRHQIVLNNLKQLADVARTAERDLADGLVTKPFLDSLLIMYGQPSASEPASVTTGS
jgi:hypothetical protein